MTYNYYDTLLPSHISLKHKGNINRQMYPKIVFLIGLFYIIPSLQFVFFQSQDSNIECYFNYKCLGTLGSIKSFNSVISNILYLIYGLIFIITVKIHHSYKHINETDLDLIKKPYLYYAIGISLIFEGICSATYHLCPTKLNFQFDTSFMFIGGVLMFITIYSKRNYEPEPSKIFTFLGFLCLINILPLADVTDKFEPYFWSCIFIIVAFVMINISLHIYYSKESIPKLTQIKFVLNKKNLPKITVILFLNMFSLGTYIWAIMTQTNFTDWILAVIIVNMILYFCYYLIQKMIHKEKIAFKLWIWLAVDLIIFILSLIFFVKTSYNIFITPNESRKLNKPCIVADYFDYHDIWHMLSATGLFIFMNIVYFLDNHIDGIIGNNIHVF